MLSDTKIKSLKSKEKVYRVLDAERLYIEIRQSEKMKSLIWVSTLLLHEQSTKKREPKIEEAKHTFKVFTREYAFKKIKYRSLDSVKPLFSYINK